MFDWLDYLMRLLVESVMGLSMETRLGSSIHFFLYDTIKIAILLILMIFSISYIRSYFPPERTKKILERFGGITGNIMASLLGIVTPFCSCSSVPIFIGFVEAGIPLGVTFSFLITSPIVNEVAFAHLVDTFGWKLGAAYAATGVIIGVTAGIIVGKMGLEKEVEEYVYQIKSREAPIERMTLRDRADFAWESVKEIVGRIWLYLLIGIGLGAIIHGLVPQDLIIRYAGPNNPFAVFAAVLLGIPLYSNAIGTIPIAEALIDKGAGIGTALSFMMAITALSLPEAILLRKVIKPKLIAAFFGVTGGAIILVGYLFNLIAPYLI